MGEMIAALKAATRLAVASAGGPLAASVAIGLAEGTISRASRVDYPDSLSLRHAALLEAAGPSTHISAALARLSGCALLQIEDAPAAPLVAADLAGVGERSGAVFAEAARALADHHISGAEAVALVERLHALSAAADAAIAGLARKA